MLRITGMEPPAYFVSYHIVTWHAQQHVYAPYERNMPRVVLLAVAEQFVGGDARGTAVDALGCLPYAYKR